MTRAGVIQRLAVVAIVLLAGSNWVAFRELSLGGRPLDLRFLGYELEQARMWALSLSFEARESYRSVYLILDTAFIGCLFALLCTVAGGLRPRRYWWAIIGFAVVFAAADLTENYLVSQIVAQDMSHVALASLATRIKFAALLLAAAATITCWRQEQGMQ